jgi:hypothetical protein
MNTHENRERSWLFFLAIKACGVVANIGLYCAELTIDLCEVILTLTDGIGEQRRARQRGRSTPYHPHDR